MEKIFTLALLVVTIFICGCANEKSADKPTPPESEITIAEAKTKLAELSQGLDVQSDDMKEVTFYRCHINHDLYPPIWIIPYVAVDKDFKVTLYQDILYVGRETLDFDKLYVKTSSGVETFHYEKTVKSLNRYYIGEEYNGQRTAPLYKELQEAVADGSAKFRLEGKTFGERELTADEISEMAKVFAIYEFLSDNTVEK